MWTIIVTLELLIHLPGSLQLQSKHRGDNRKSRSYQDTSSRKRLYQRVCHREAFAMDNRSRLRGYREDINADASTGRASGPCKKYCVAIEGPNNNRKAKFQVLGSFKACPMSGNTPKSVASSSM